MSSKFSFVAIAFGSVAVLSLSFLYYKFFWVSPLKIIKQSGEPAKQPDKEKEKQNVTVEDVDEEDDSDDDEGNEQSTETKDEREAREEMEALKAKYDSATKMAPKYIAGQMYDKAVEKITEALDLSNKVPVSEKDIVTLYNNRSAMYEKLSALDKALTDITVVLTIDVSHIRARTRRARIFELQGKQRLALEEYVTLAFFQQKKQDPNGGEHQQKIDSLVQTLAIQTTPALYEGIRNTTTARVLPSKAHSKNYLESYPDMHSWSEYYHNMSEKSSHVADLVSALVTSVATAASSATDIDDSTAAVSTELAGDDNDVAISNNNTTATTDEEECSQLASILELVRYDLIMNHFDAAFKRIAALPQPFDFINAVVVDITTLGDNGIPLSVPALPENSAFTDYVAPYVKTTAGVSKNVLLSLQYELLGFEYHLRCHLRPAIAAYQQSLRYHPENVDVRLKLANVFLEQGDIAIAKSMYNEMLRIVDNALLRRRALATGVALENATNEVVIATTVVEEVTNNKEEDSAEVVATAVEDTTTTTTEEPAREAVSEESQSSTVVVASAESDAVDSSTVTTTDAIAATATETPVVAEEKIQDQTDNESLSLLIIKAWTLLHRATVFVTKDENGKYSAGSVENAMKDIEEVLSIVQGSPLLLTVPAAKAARVAALIRSVHVITQTRASAGLELTDADSLKAAQAIAEAKKLDPSNESVLLMEAELLSGQGMLDHAFALVEKVLSNTTRDKEDCTPIFIKASLTINKGMLLIRTPQSLDDIHAARQLLEEADEVYKQALAMEPNAIEVINQYAQYCGVMQNFDKAVTLLRQAIPLARTREDIHDLNQLLIVSEAQAKAISIVMSS